MNPDLHPADLAAFFKALALARRAQAVATKPLADVVAEMTRSGGELGSLSIDRLSRATVRATSRWAKWVGGRDTCLVRSLVLGALVARRGRAVLNIGFRPGHDQSGPDGHAWLTLDGYPVGSDTSLVSQEYARLVEFPFVYPGEVA